MEQNTCNITTVSVPKINQLANLISKNSEDVKLINKSSGKSTVWKTFSILMYKNTEVKNVVVCNKCKKIFQYNSKSGGSHLKRHDVICHKSKNLGNISDSCDKPTLSHLLKRKVNVEDVKLTNIAAINFICQDVRPLSIIEGKGFKVNIVRII